MANNFIPDDVSDFIVRHIDSIAQLEALLLLRARPGEQWDIATMARRLYISEADTVSILSRLCADGFVAIANGFYQYTCERGEMRLTIERLANTYSRHLISITNMIHAKPSKIREFSDAFKFRRDP